MGINKQNLKPVSCPGLVRAGRSGDGGYIVPSAVISSVDTLLSFGVGDDWSFEEDIGRQNPSARIEAYDHTVSPDELRQAPAKKLIKLLLYLSALRLHSAKCMYRSFIDARTKYQLYKNFFLRGDNVRHFQLRIGPRSDGEDIAPSQILSRLCLPGKGASILLKMDIEGAEYEIMNQILEFSDYIKCMVIEFHDIDRRLSFNAIIVELLKNFSIVHIHGNNYGPINEFDNFPSTVEVTLVNNELLGPSPQSSSQSYPIPGLDFPNKPSVPDHQLMFD